MKYIEDIEVIVRHFSGNKTLAIEHVRKRAKMTCSSFKVTAADIAAELRNVSVAASAAFDDEDRQANRSHVND